MIRRWLVRASLVVLSVSLLSLQAHGQRKVAPGLVPGGSSADRNKTAKEKTRTQPATRARTTKPVADTQNQPDAEPATADADTEEQRQRQIIERFLSVLEKNPRRGTALDRVYGHHVERGTLEQLVDGYRERTAKNAADGPAWMMLGLIDAQRGQDAAAVAAFQQAEKQMPKNYLASYYLGQSLVLVGQPEAAAEAFERAIERKPPPAEMLDVFQALGRVYQRAQRNEQALAVWTRLEKLFPNDARVAEQIASTLAEEGQRDAALARYQKLAKLTKDRYRQSMFRMEAAELELRLGRTDQALADFESMLAELNPDSWLHREVRRRIEEAFLRNDDQAGLAKYYDTWLTKHTDDVDAMARLAHTLAAQGRVPEAQKWLEQAIKLAPSRKELRLTFIEQLVYDQRYADAIVQYEALDKADPDNPDYLREWGQLVLKDTARPETERRQAAAAVWRRMTDARPKDPLIATQVADLFRQAQMEDEAIELYRRAVELAPDAAQYREYLGEYYHQLKRSDEALATWRQIAAGDNRNSKNLARLAEVLSGFGYLKEAVETMGAACALEDDDFAMQLKYAELLAQDARYDDALARLDAADKLAESAEETEAVLQQRIKSFEAADRLTTETESLDKTLAAGQDATAERWYLLARYREAAHQLPEATAAILKSLELDEQSLPALAASARIHEAAGSLQAAADAYRKLAAVDRRSRTTYLTEVAKLEARLGRREAALAAGRDLLAAAPGNPEQYEFFAELCFQLGEGDEGLETLRRSLRVNPSDPQVVLTLARALAERFRTDEAIELYWRAFDKATELEAKLDVVTRLAELYLQTNHFDRLLERLGRERREANAERELTICLAQAYHSAGDYGTAIQELERLLSQNASDTQLLQQISNLLEAEGDVAGAAKYQQQLVHLAPGKEAETRLAMLLSRAGDTEQASAIWARLTDKEEEPERVFKAIDSLVSSGRADTALVITERLLRQNPRDWEALYREGAALASERPAEAAARFRSILALRLPDDDKSSQAKSRQKQSTKQPTGVAAQQRALLYGQSLPVQDRMQQVYQIRSAAGLQENYAYSNRPQVWSPDDFGQVRLAALAWLLSLSQRESKHEEFVAEQRQASEAASKSTQADEAARARWDWYYLQLVRQEQREQYEAAKAFAAGDDPMGWWVYLTSLSNRTAGRNVQTNAEGEDNVDPLPADELDRMLVCYRALRQKKPELLTQSGYYGQQLVSNVNKELERGKRKQEADEIYRDALTQAEQPAAINSMLSLAAGRGDIDAVMQLIDRLARQPVGRSSANMASYFNSSLSNSLVQLINQRMEAKAPTDVPRILDRYLTFTIEQKRQAPPARANRGRANVNQPSSYYLVIGKQSQRVQFSWPQANDYYDHSGLQLLRAAYEHYKRGDLVSDLVAHFRELTSKQTTPAGKIYPQLGLAYLLWWTEDQTAALAALREACGLAPDDLNLTLDLAELLETNGDLEDALAEADTVKPLEQATMQRREMLALRLAVRAGDVERAREAAERLFGLRLDAETQVQLAAQMRQLGMHELAEAVMSRAHRQAGNRMAALVALMVQYQGQSQPETAAQVAHQILRRAPTRQMQPFMGTTEADNARSQAIQVLARLGKLTTMIERAEAQLKNSPKSVQICQTLAEYYQAAGQRENSTAMYQHMAEIRPDDARLRYQVAQNLVQAGQPAAALDHFRAALKKEPSLYQRNYWQVEQAFRQANKLDELLKMFEEVDLRSLGNYWTVANLVSNMMNDEKHREQAMQLFRKAWQAYPDQRSSLVGYMHNSRFWELPETYQYAREAIIPKAAAPSDAWGGMAQIMSYSGDGRVNCVLSRLLDAAARGNQLEALSEEVQTAMTAFPHWTGGKALQAVLQIRRGQTAAGRAALEELLGNKRDPIPVNVCWVIGQELENYSDLNDLALKLYESTADDAQLNNIGLDFSYSPLKRLVNIYHTGQRDEDARALVLKLAKTGDSNNYDPNYAAYRRVNTLTSIGQQLLELGYPADAAQMFNELLADREAFELASRFGGDYQRQQAEQGMAKALETLTPEHAQRTIDALLKPATDANKDGPAVELLLLVQPRDLARADLTSMLANALAMFAKTPDVQAKTRATLADLAGQHPRDLSVRIAAALAALAGDDEATIEPAVRELAELVAQTPLEDLPEGARPNSRQRAEAARQMGLWLVARECFKHEAVKASGEALAERALAAARRQLDKYYALAMLRQWGQWQLDRGDLQAAERSWGEMLDLVLPKPVEKKKSARAVHDNLKAVAAAAAKANPFRLITDRTVQPTAAKPQSTKPARTPGLPTATLEQFNQAIEIAMLAAEHDLHELSLRAVREALRPGPPVPPAPVNQGVRRVVRVGMNDQTDLSTVFQRVQEKMSRLEPLWRRHNTPPEAVYEVLAEAVMPDARPGEILLYAPPLAAGALSSPPSVGRMLAEWAVRADRVPQLRERIASRAEQPLAALPAHVLLVQIAIVSGNRPAASEGLKWLGERLKTEQLQNTAEIACHAALPALADRELASTAITIAERAATNLASQPNEEPAASLLLLLARHQLRHGESEAGRKHLLDYLEVCQRMNVRYSGDYGAYRRKEQVAKVAGEFANAGQLDDAMEMLGQYADSPDFQYGETTIASAVAAVIPRLAALDADDRYERLKQWSLPTKDRRSVRVLGAFVPQHVLPDCFAQQVDERVQGSGFRVQHLASAPLPEREPSDAAAVARSASRQNVAQPPSNVAQPRSAESPKANTRQAVPPNKENGARIVALSVRERKAGEPLAEHTAEAPALRLAPVGFDNDAASTLVLLVDAAHATGKLDELSAIAAELTKDPAEKTESGKHLRLLTEIAAGRGRAAEPLAKKLAAEMSQYLPNQDQRSKRIRWPDYLVACACAADDRLNAVGGEMLGTLRAHAQRIQDHHFMSHLQRDLAAAVAASHGGQPPSRRTSPGLAHWDAAAHITAQNHAAGAPAAWWVADQHQVAHFGGPDYDYLFFAYPLTGSFRFTADVLDGGWTEGDVSYGGLCFEPFAFSKNAYIWPVGKHEQFTRSLTSLRQGNYNQISIEVEPEKFRFWVNGQMVFEQEQKGTPTAPWLAIYTNRERRSVFRNLRLSGRPEIPRQVSLLQADRLAGWLSNFYNESQPPRMAPLDANNTSGYWSTWSRVQGDDFDWQAKDGVLHGRRNQAVGAAEAAQSRLYYQRPLRDGDTLRYEFFYESDAVMVYPALGRLAFLVEPDGVRLHWITDGEDDATGLRPDNAVLEENYALEKPSLKPGEWNTMELRLADDQLLLSLNGVDIYRRPIEESNDRLFSFFHYKDRTAVQVREAVLTGDWPQTLSDEEMANLLSPADDRPDEGNESLLGLLLGEENVFLSAWQVWQEARGLAPQRRYEFLREWVLPNPTIGGPIRLYGDATPADPAPPVSESLGVKMPPDGRRVHTGGELVSPAIELVKTAQEIGKLDELKRRVETVPARDPATLRSQIALLALIALQGQQDDQAQERLSQLYTLAKQASDDDAEYLRWPALVAATQAMNHEPSRRLAADMTHFMVDAIQRKYINPKWELQIRHARDRARLLLFPEGEHATLEGGSPLVQWQPVTHATAASRGNAHPPAHWLRRPGELKHLAGHDHDYVYFSVPLRGDFQVDAQISTFGWREMETMYAGLRCGVVYDHKNFKVSNYERDRPNVPIAPPLDNLGNWYDYRLTVKDGVYTAAVNGRKVFEERLSSQPDPWLAFHSWGAYSGEMRQVRITGQPTVPDVIDLTASANLDGWLADYYSESLGGGDSNWQKRGEEIYGRKLDDQHGAARESLLQYHRPMLEDGQIDYEFYYQPETAMVHPALDRLVLRLEPSGVRVHWLTDGAMERGGLTPDNAHDEPANRRGPAKLPLRTNDWNRVRLTLTGDRMTLALNDVEIYERDLGPTNQRTFGLFHFAQRSESRVRHVNYRGDWPRALPPLAEQELAVLPATRAAIDTKKLRATFAVDFRGQKPLPKGLELIGDDQRKLVTRSAAGARVLLPAGQEKPNVVGYVTRFPIRGDFEIVARFTGLSAKPAPPAWGPGIDLHLKPAGPEQYDVTFERRNDVDRPILQAGGFHTLVGPNDRVGRLVSHSQPAVSGTFKFVRKGPLLYYLFAADDSDEFLLWDEAPIGTADINSVEFIARAFSPASAVDVVLEQMSIRAESFPGR